MNEASRAKIQALIDAGDDRIKIKDGICTVRFNRPRFFVGAIRMEPIWFSFDMATGLQINGAGQQL